MKYPPALWCLSVGGVLCLSAPHTIQSTPSLLLAYDRLLSASRPRLMIVNINCVRCSAFFPSPGVLSFEFRRVCRAGTRTQKRSGIFPSKIMDPCARATPTSFPFLKPQNFRLNSRKLCRNNGAGADMRRDVKALCVLFVGPEVEKVVE